VSGFPKPLNEGRGVGWDATVAGRGSSGIHGIQVSAVRFQVRCQVRYALGAMRFALSANPLD
jgi:hypothetical protein